MADQDIILKLNILNTTYLNNIDNPFLGSKKYGAFNSSQVPAVCSSSPQCMLQYKCINYIYTGTNMLDIDDDNLITLSNGASLPSTNQQVSIFAQGANDYSRVAANSFVFSANGSGAGAGDSVNFVSSSAPLTTDINCMELLLYLNNSSSTTMSNIPISLYYLQGLYAWYAMFDKTNWIKYTSGQNVTLSIPDIQQGSSTQIVFVPVTINQNTSGYPHSTKSLQSQLIALSSNSPYAFLNNAGNTTPTIINIMNLIVNFKNGTTGIFDQTNFDPFTARRIIHLHIIMMQYQIAKSYTNSANEVSHATTAEKVVYAIAALLESSNNTLMDPNTGAFVNVLDAVQGRIKDYNFDQKKITSLDSDVRNLQSNIAIDSNALSQEIIYQNAIKNYYYVALVLLIITSFTVIGMYIKPSDPNKKVIVSSGLAVIVVIIAFVLNYYLQNTLSSEGFYVDHKNINQSMSSTGKSYLENFVVADDINALEISTIIPNARTFLDNTISLVTALNNYNIYGRVNIGMNNQYSYYNDAKQSLLVKDKNIQNYTTINYITQINYAARMNLVLALSIIMSVSTAAYFALNGSASSQGIIRILAIIFMLGAIFAFVLETMTHVRNHPKQKYWAAPKTTK